MTNTVQNNGTVAVDSVVEDGEATPPLADDHVIAQWQGGSLTMGELRQQYKEIWPSWNSNMPVNNAKPKSVSFDPIRHAVSDH